MVVEECSTSVDVVVEEVRSKMRKIPVDAEVVEEERSKMKIPVDVEVEEEPPIRFLLMVVLLVLVCNDEVVPDHRVVVLLVLVCNDEVVRTDTKVDICSSCSDAVLAEYRSFPVLVSVRIYCLQEEDEEQSYHVLVDICSSYSDDVAFDDVLVDIRSSFEDEEEAEAPLSFRVSASVPLFYR